MYTFSFGAAVGFGTRPIQLAIKIKLSTINYKTPVHPCNVVFNLKAPLGDTKPNNFSPVFFILR